MTVKILTIFLFVLAFGAIIHPVIAQQAGPSNPNANTTTAYNLLHSNQTTSANNPVLTVKTDLPSYNQEDTIVITGHVNNMQSATAITLRLFNSHQNLISVASLLPSSDGSFTKTFLATGPLWKDAGTYTLVTQYGKYTQANATFHYSGGTGTTIITQAINATYPLQSGGQIYNIPYIIKGATVKSMDILAQQHALEIVIVSTSDGSITVMLPRDMIDAKQSNEDAKFGITVNDNLVTQFGESASQNVRILSIPFHVGDIKIDIVGTPTGSGSTVHPNNPYLGCPDCNNTGNIRQISPISITVTTDKPVYDHNSKILITGHVTWPYLSQDVNVKITSPSGNVVAMSQTSLDNDGYFTQTASTVGNLWFENGKYTVSVQRGDNQAIINSTTFQLSGVGPVIAPPPAITVVTDKPSYNAGDKITISGNIQEYISGTPVTVRIIGPTGNLVKLTQVDLGSDGIYSTSVTSDALWSQTGTYWVLVQFGSKDVKTRTSFYFNSENGLPASPSTTASNPVLAPTPQDVTNNAVAAEVNVGNNKTETKSIDNNVSVQTTTNTPDSLGVQVSATDQTGPKIIAFNLAAKSINVENLKDLGVMYDGKPIAPAPNMDAILHAKPTDSPSFAIVVTQSGVQVLVLVPHFSTHSITITNMSKVIPTVPEFPFAMLAFMIATFSIVLIPKIRYHRKPSK